MGFFKRGQMLKPITDATFALKADEITKEPVRSPLGMHLLQVTEVKQAGRKELAEVEREVAKTLLESRAQEGVAKTEAEAFLAQLKSGKKLEDLTVTEEEERTAQEAKVTLSKPSRRDTAWILKSQDSDAAHRCLQGDAGGDLRPHQRAAHPPQGRQSGPVLLCGGPQGPRGPGYGGFRHREGFPQRSGDLVQALPGLSGLAGRAAQSRPRWSSTPSSSPPQTPQRRNYPANLALLPQGSAG